MIELQGKNNTAKVYTDNIDSETISQIITLLNQEFIKDSKIRIMSDCHAGSGCVIGTTMTITDKIVPNLVGVDIGCQVSAVQLKETDADLIKLDRIINKYVPAGFNVHDTAIANFNLDFMLAEIDNDLAQKSLGTLGGGNHFIELDKDTEGHLWLIVHTGSRHLGLEVAKHYQELGYKALKSEDIQKKIKEAITKLKAEGNEREIEGTIKKIKASYIAPNIPKDLCYITGQDMIDYLHDIDIVQKYATLNHKTIINTITSHMGWHIVDEIHTMHNYIDVEHNVLRKGAVSAQKGEKLIIPMNMRDGSLICIGKGNPEWNYSAPHGAGRILSRSQAKEVVDINAFKDSMQGIYTTSVNESTLDESPFVYKPMDEIMENIRDTVDILTVVKPIYNFKSSMKNKEIEKKQGTQDEINSNDEFEYE